MSRPACADVQAQAHVQMFSPWEYNYDPKVVELLESAKMYTEEEASPSTQQGISPTGAEYVSQYLSKMARWLEQQECAEVRLQTTVKSVVREGCVLDGCCRWLWGRFLFQFFCLSSQRPW